MAHFPTIMRLPLVVLCLGVGLLIYTPFLAAAQKCAPLLPIQANRPLSFDLTETLIAYLKELTDEQILKVSSLEVMLEKLELGELINPISGKYLSVAEELHRVQLESYIKDERLQRAVLLDWLKEFVSLDSMNVKERIAVNTAAQEVIFKMQFYPIKAGKFTMGDSRRSRGDFRRKNKVAVELTHDFEMTSTPITQYQWAEVMGNNPSKNWNWRIHETEVFIFNGTRVIPNHPVTSVAWVQALEFANRMSELHGLRPVYKMNRSWIQTEPRVEVSLADPTKSVYEAEGYRLPTEAEQEFVLRDRGRALGHHIFGNEEAELYDYAWLLANSPEDQDLPVADRKPIMIDGNPFYDLYGLVGEWSFDTWNEKSIKGVNPVSFYDGMFKAYRGTEAEAALSYQANFLQGEGHVGFRLVRTLPPSGSK